MSQIEFTRIGMGLKIGTTAVVLVGMILGGAFRRGDAAGNVGAAVVGIIGVILLAFTWGQDIAHWFGGRVANTLMPTDWPAEPLPRHAIADARVHQGKYDEAIEEFRRVLAEHPHDLYSRLRLAEIYSKSLHNHERALAEMAITVSLPLPPEKWVLAAHRLADLHLEAGDTASAKTALRQIIDKLPQSRAAQMAQNRLATIVPVQRRAEGSFEVRL